MDHHLEKEEQDTWYKLKQEDKSWCNIKDDSHNDYRIQLTKESDISHDSQLWSPIDFKPKLNTGVVDDGSTGSVDYPSEIHITPTKIHEVEHQSKSQCHVKTDTSHEGQRLINGIIKPHVCDICMKSFLVLVSRSNINWFIQVSIPMLVIFA